jgi:hypothetical protein
VSAGQSAQTISLWGAQVEHASAAGPYVSTIGTARPTGGTGGTVTYPYSLLQPGSHSISVYYSGDTNFVASTSNTLAVVVSQKTPAITLTASPNTPQSYGTSVTLTAAVATPVGNPDDVPSGTVHFFDGNTSLGTVTMSAGGAALTLSGTASLTPGSHSITAVFSGDTHFNGATSSILTYVVTKVSGVASVTATSSRNPSTYGDSVTFSITLTSPDAIPTGSVSLVDTSTSTTLGTVTLTNGAGTLTIPLFAAGTHTITFTYSGDSNYN